MIQKEPPLITLQIRIPQDLMERIDRYRLKLAMRPTRSQTIRFLLEHATLIAEEVNEQNDR